MFSVATDRVRERCGLEGNAYDARINALAAEFVAALSRLIAPGPLADESLHPVLNLGATELVAAEMMAFLAREPGARDTLVLGDLRIEPDPDDGFALRQQGERRLAPFLRPDLVPRTGVGAGGDKAGDDA